MNSTKLCRETENKELIKNFMITAIVGWLVYYTLFLVMHHFFPVANWNNDLDFMLHDNYTDTYPDFFRDFFEVNRSAASGDCYLTGSCANYPPLALVIGKFWSIFTPSILNDENIYITRKSISGIATLAVFIGISIWGIFKLLYSFYKRHLELQDVDIKKRLAILLAVGGISSYSLLFGAERGNYILFAIIAFLVFAFTYETNEVVSAVALTICACLKVYPALLFVLFLQDKKLKGFFIGIGTGVIGLFAPMIFLKGTLLEQFGGFIGGVLSFSATSQVTGGTTSFAYVEQHSNSFENLFRVIALWIKERGLLLSHQETVIKLLQIGSKVGLVCLIGVAIYVFCVTKPFWKRLCVLTCLLHLIPSNTYDYMLSFFLAVIAIAICTGEKKDKKYVVMMTLLACVPKTYYFFRVGVWDVSIQCILNPFLMVCILLEMFEDAMKEKKNNEKKREVSNFDLNATNLIKGIAISQMVYFHAIGCMDESAYKMVSPLFKHFFGNFGNVCVSFFVFLTVYRYTIQTNKATTEINSLKQYKNTVVKRLSNLYSGYWFVFIIAFVLSPVMSSGWMDFRVAYRAGNVLKSFFAFFLNVIGLTNLFYGDNIYTLNQTWWYMSVAVLLVMLVPVFIWVYKKLKFETVILLLGVSIALSNVKYVQYLFAVALGVWFASEGVFEKLNKLHRNSITFRLTEGVIAGAVACFWFLFRRSPFGGQWAIIADTIYAVCMIVAVFNFISPIGSLKTILSFLGKHSGNIFYTHSLLYIYYPLTSKLFYGLKYDLLIWAAILLVSLGVSCIFEYVKDQIQWKAKVRSLFGRLIRT